MYILLIESDPVIRHSTAQYFKHQGAKVGIASGALQAIQACDDHKPDVIVLDISLTGHSGIEFLHEFRSYSDWHSIPVIAWSMQSYTPSQTKALQHMGVAKVLYKSTVSLQNLWSQVQLLVAAVHE